MFKKLTVVFFIGAGLFFFSALARSQGEGKVPDGESMAQRQLQNPDIADDLGPVEKILPLPESAGGQALSKDDDLYAQVELFSYALTTIQSEYVEPKKAKDIIYGALTGMLSSLDPHSQFLTPEDYKDLKTETEGKFGGLGIEISIRDGLLTIVTPIEDTPAWKAGMKAGDRIVKIDDTVTKDITLSDAVKKMRGKPGTKVKITVLRESEYKIHVFDITREIIHVQDIKDPHVIEGGVGYLRFAEFRENSYQQFITALKKLRDEGASSLILDLRNNPGGLLNVAIDISEIFLHKGLTIVSTKGRHESQTAVSISRNAKDEFADWPIVVLINEGSASGSEILAGALKDNKRAVILGSKSFGKGSVQSVIPLPDGAGLRLTTSKYFTPSGVSIHETGIMPDIVVERVYPRPDEDGETPEDAEGLQDEGEPALKKEPEKKVLKKKQDVEQIFEKIEQDQIADPNEIEKRRREVQLKKRMASDNQIQAAINVIKGIQVYKQLSSGEK